MSAKQKSIFGLTCYLVLGGAFVTGSIAMSGGLFNTNSTAMAEVVVPEAGQGKEIQILSTAELMKILMDPQYEQVRDAIENPPEKRTEWRQLYITSFALAELSNLMYSRHDEDFQATPEWTTEIDHAMTVLLAFTKSVRERSEYPVLKENYLAVVASCNDCHNKFEPGEIDKIEVPRSWMSDEEAAGEVKPPL